MRVAIIFRHYLAEAAALYFPMRVREVFDRIQEIRPATKLSRHLTGHAGNARRRQARVR